MIKAPRRRFFATVAIGILLLLPFAGKAFHIDDAGFLDMARAIGWNPLHAPNTSPSLYASTHTVLLPFLIKIFVHLVGESEPFLHVVFAFFPLLALVSIERFYHRGFAGPQQAALPAIVLLLAMPAFLVNAQTIMADVPSLACALLGMYFFLRAVEDRHVRSAIIAGLLFAVATFITYQMLFALPVAFCYAAMRKRGWQSAFLALAVPVALFAGWILLIFLRFGVLPIAPEHFAQVGQGIAGELKRGLRPDIFWGKVVFTLAMLGASLLFAYAYRCVLMKKLLAAARSVLIFSVLAYFPATMFVSASRMQVIGLSLLLGVCMAVLVEVVQTVAAAECDDRKRTKRAFFLVWGSAVVVYVIALMPFGSARYLLPALPAFLLLLLDMPETLEIGPRRRLSAQLVIGFALLFGLASAYADYRYADVYRDFAREVVHFKRGRPESTTVWYIGKWGMSYYLEKVGSRLLQPDSKEPKKGDIIIVPEMPRFWMPSQEVQMRMTFYASRAYRSPFPLRLFNGRSNAGFYAHHWGILPFAFSREPDEIFVIYEVTS